MHHEGEQSKGSRARVLVVDDDRDVSVALERSLKHLGYDVLVASDGTEGFEQALRAEPAVVLADVHMPGMDGHALLRRLMRSGLHASVILMSGQGELDDAIGAFREGAVDYLKKPWMLQDLAAVLHRAMGLAGALRELGAPPEKDHPAGQSPSVEDGPPLDAAAFIEGLARGAATAQGLAIPSPRFVIRRLRSQVVEGNDAAVIGDAIDDLASLIQTAPALSAAVLRTVGGIDDVSASIDARSLVAQVSHQALRESMETLALRDAFPIRVAALRTLNDRIWRFSVARALAMRGIADAADLKVSRDRHQYFLSGLMLDVGASYLLSEISQEMQRLDRGVADSARMTAAVGIYHAQVGGQVLRRWGMPGEWATLTDDHHREPAPGPEHLGCAAVLGGALAVRLAGFGDPSGERDLRADSLARCAYTLGLGDTELRRLTKSLTEDAARIWTACT